ncbi:MAG TPA: metal-dependent hydrolase [candidate division Zixibacteria bacterium]|nr:metal-dependent hydrolase [candidate division Zixibacteria bacterium]
MVKVKWLGHSAFAISDGKYRLLVDPFITGNPKATVSAKDVTADFILLTHGHGDHLGDTMDIARRCNSLIIAPNELGHFVENKGLRAHRMHIGGSAKFDFGRVKLTPAFHGSAIIQGDQIIYTGMPCGFVISIGGKNIYHAGDTGLFGDMKLIGERSPLDLALLPIGDNFTMGPEDAAFAVDLLKPKIAMPMHYGTWPPIDASPEVFKSSVKWDADIVILAPGEEITL